MRWCLLLLVLLVASPVAAADLLPRLVGAGFALERPEPQAARRGAYAQTELTLYSPGLSFWVDVAALQAGDHLVLTLKDPDGGLMAARDLDFDLPKDDYFAFAGMKRPSRGWKRGPYTGTVQVVRGDWILIEESIHTALP
ncbi:hypothetical protein [Dongia sedimenti]|uniref:Uncharacterized protein n=1 Tax=Dongia sedimenti TaxID=3064282 RepID=A0ABU0YIK3_9PROT|nr:hypothetical protein [Rhodospirillaceae bacterium R-7]